MMKELRAALYPPLALKPGENKIEPNPQIITRSWEDVYAWAGQISRLHPNHAIQVFEVVETIRVLIPKLESRKKMAEYLCLTCKKEITIQPSADCANCWKKKAGMAGMAGMAGVGDVAV